MNIQKETIKIAIQNNVRTLRHLHLVCDIESRPDVETVMARCAKGLIWDNEKPFSSKYRVDGYGSSQVTENASEINREHRLIFTSSLVLSALVGILIPVFGGTVVYGAKNIAEYETRKIVAAEREV